MIDYLKTIGTKVPIVMFISKRLIFRIPTYSQQVPEHSQLALHYKQMHENLQLNGDL